MSTNARASHLNGSAALPPTSAPSAAPERSYFEQQREILVGEIAQSLEHVLQNINKLNRSLEEVIAVGNEFSPVEALWSQFEGVMAKDADVEREGESGAGNNGGGETEAGREDGGEEGETEVGK